MRADERPLSVSGVAVRLTGAGVDSLVLHHCLHLTSRQVGEPRHALPVAVVGLERGVVAMRLDNVSRLRLR